MSVSVSMPQLGESVTEGTVTRWLKKEGERVEVDEPLLEVSTDKVDTEIPSPASGILRGISVDEPALIAALKDGTIRAAGLDVFADEPNVPAELMALPNAVLLPHVGSASIHTRDAMGQLGGDNLASWFEKGRPLTPVPETPWPR